MSLHSTRGFGGVRRPRGRQCPAAPARPPLFPKTMNEEIAKPELIGRRPIQSQRAIT